MRNILLLAALAATLSACGAAEPAQAPEKPKTPDEQMVGTYEFTDADGQKMTSMLNSNHSYTDAVGGIVSDGGTWEIKDGKTCFTSGVPGKAVECYTMSGSNADGTLTATPDKGEPLKLKKIS